MCACNASGNIPPCHGGIAGSIPATRSKNAGSPGLPYQGIKSRSSSLRVGNSSSGKTAVSEAADWSSILWFPAKCALVAQLAEVLRLERKGCRFESDRGHQKLISGSKSVWSDGLVWN